MFSKKFGFQTPEQILSHLRNCLDPSLRYNLYIDSIGIRLTIEEAVGISKSEKRRINSEQPKRTRIRNAKKGRTVNLKGRVDF